jgi:PPOX class probable F420-dependent enzyme
MSEPIASRPHMPGYGVAPAAGGAGLLPWSWAVERLAASHNYWVATTTSDGAPHLAAVWALWLDDALHFSTGAGSRKARNLGADPRCSLSTQDAAEGVIVEGTAERVTDSTVLTRVLDAYRGKYGSGFPDPVADPLFAVRPRVVFGIVEHDPSFSASATRWTFVR